MTHEPDPVWAPGSAPADSFTAELERRLAPLADELEDLLDELDELDELDGLAETRGPEQAGEAVVVVLPDSGTGHADRAAEPSTTALESAPGRAWPWLLAAAVVLGFAVAVLVRAQPSAGEGAARVAGSVAGAGELAERADARVRIGVEVLDGARSRAAVRAELRERHAALARCAVELAPVEGIRVRAELDPAGALRLVALGSASADAQAEGQAAAQACVRAALADWPPGAAVAVDLELSSRRGPG